jgi:thioredoxin
MKNHWTKILIGALIVMGAGVVTHRLIANKNGGEVRAESIKENTSVSTKTTTTTTKTNSNMEHLTKETFQQKVFNYEQNKEWKYEGDLPCLIDFYADWCGPCKMVAPILEELSKEYEGKIRIYKVDTENQQELAAAFGIRSIPSLLFCPMEGQPQMAAGALPKQTMEKAINEILLSETAEVDSK